MNVRIPDLSLCFTNIYTLDLAAPPNRRHSAKPQPPTVPTSLALQTRVIDATNERERASLLASVGPKQADWHTRFARGCRCVAYTHDSDIVSYCWISFARECIGEANCDIVMPPGMAYIWDCATIPTFRGHGLYPALLRQIVAELRDAGLERFWIAAVQSNHASQQGIAKAGFRHVATVGYLRIGPWHVHWLRCNPTAPADLARLTRSIVCPRVPASNRNPEQIAHR